jgi:RimJ/RimL family protein N-acetyltransferase
VDLTTDPLTGDRIRLRELRDEDLADLTTWWQDPVLLIRQTAGALHPKPAATIAEQFRDWCRNDGIDVGLSVVTRDGGTLLGHAALFGAKPRNRTATYVIMLGPPHQGAGYGTETTRLMLRYAFAELNLHRVQLQVLGYNERAIHTYAKAGFVEEGRSREAVYRSGEWHDEVHMGILAREWWAGR